MRRNCKGGDQHAPVGKKMSQHRPTHKELPFGWINADPDHATRVPIVNFDYESVFQQLDGKRPEPDPQTPEPLSLLQILTPRELQHAYAVAQTILKKNSLNSRAARASWRDPASRARRLAGVLRTAKNPEAQSKKSASLRRSWQTRDRDIPRDRMMKLWRERRQEFIASIHAFTSRPEYRWRHSKLSRAQWADPAFRHNVISRLRTAEVRRRNSMNLIRYFQEHPEARKKSSENTRACWRDSAYRKRNLDARKVTAAKIRRQRSARTRSMRAHWSNPLIRQRRMENLPLRGKSPEVRQKMAAAMRRYWQTNDRQRLRDVMNRLWHDRQPELMFKLSFAGRDYYQSNPEARKQLAERARAMWRSPEHRRRYSQTMPPAKRLSLDQLCPTRAGTKIESVWRFSSIGTTNFIRYQACGVPRRRRAPSNSAVIQPDPALPAASRPRRPGSWLLQQERCRKMDSGDSEKRRWPIQVADTRAKPDDSCLLPKCPQ